jgi:hypothetical protein
MSTARYYSFVAFIVLAVPYMWGVPRHLPFLLLLSVACFVGLKKVIPRIGLNAAPTDPRRIFNFLGAVAIMFGHAALIRYFIISA